ncbi:VOC family protein [Arthrobacter antioxidans]|uniref:VOC family protein n=1 Tax=Arthrobacter antioxidans TaxID=2895818 RepID=UPI001FFEB4A8|nr:VOC family protein [Arthrobacter antioxidans]
MLRVRPLVHTPDLPGAARFLQALGLAPAQDPAPNGSYAVFDAGSGRVALHACVPGRAEDGTTDLAFDVADVREFARRTAEAGARVTVELSDEGHGVTARITAPDGLSFLADAGPRETGAPPSPLAVLALWYTPRVGRAVRVLEDIGAKPGTSSAAATRHDFRAKNGGLVAVRTDARTRAELAFEYDGDVRDLVRDLTAGGFEPVVTDESHGRSLRVRSPWGAEVRIDEWQRDSAVH